MDALRVEPGHAHRRRTGGEHRCERGDHRASASTHRSPAYAAGAESATRPPCNSDLIHAAHPEQRRGAAPADFSLQPAAPSAIPAFVTTRFDRDTEVRRIDAAPGVIAWEARIDRGWWVVRGPNGGYIAAILLRALADAVGSDRAPRSLTIHYTAPPEEGPVRIEARVERVGRSLSTVSGRLLQGDRLLALALGAFSKPRAGPVFDDAKMPDAPPPEDCASFTSMIPMHDRYEYRHAVGALPGSGADRAVIGGWIRSAEPRRADAALVAAFTDAWPPACFAWASDRGEIGAVPTVDLTIHFRRDLPLANARPDDFYLAVFRSRFAEQGFVEEDGEVWSRDGLLLAQSRQLAVIGWIRTSPGGQRMDSDLDELGPPRVIPPGCSGSASP